MKAWKVRISGSYRAANDEIIDFEHLEGVIPYCQEQVGVMHIQGRYAPLWIANAKESYPSRVVGMREVYIDEMEAVEVPAFSYIGKDIKEMSAEELQDVATAKDIRRVPLYKKTSLREAREKTYVGYMEEILKQRKAKTFDYPSAPAIIVDANIRHNDIENGSNEDEIEDEQAAGQEMTLDDLKRVARGMGISVKGNLSKERLQALIRGEAA